MLTSLKKKDVVPYSFRLKGVSDTKTAPLMREQVRLPISKESRTLMTFSAMVKS